MSNHIIDQIISQADIVKIIGKHVELKRSGNEFKGCCPFHGEKTPSFFVNPQKGLYNCFGCGVAGNALTFLKDYEHLTTKEALQTLSQQTGIELPKEPLQKNLTYQKKISTKNQPNQLPQTIQHFPDTAITTTSNPALVEPIFIENQSHFFAKAEQPVENFTNSSGNLYELLQQINQFYQQQLWQNPIALAYFQERGLTDNTIRYFELGYAPTGWQHLEQAFPQDIEGLKILGLVRTSQKGREFDLLRHRVIFPIRDTQGRTVGFAGRALSNEDMPKYINSSDSPVFHKQHILYGLFEGRQARTKDWLVVEGYMDVISLHQAGVYGAVASMGTALATSQIDKLLQLNPTLTLCFDGDSAGQQAAWRAMESSLPVLTDGKELRFLTLPQQHDPDSFVKAHGLSAMQQQIEQAIPLSQYIFATLSQQFDLSIAEGRNKLLTEVNQLTKKLPKGSFAWLLREDMRSRLGLGKRQQTSVTLDNLINFSGELTSQLQLQLCFLYQPELLTLSLNHENNHDLIKNIFQKSQENHVKFHKNPLNLTEFQPITWQDFSDVQLLTLVNWIQQLQPHLTSFTQQQSHLDDIELINAKAHFILSGLPAQQRHYLLPHWAAFFAELSQRFVTDITDLVTEILIQLVLDTLQKRTKTEKNFTQLLLIRRQIQIIFNWQRVWLERKTA